MRTGLVSSTAAPPCYDGEICSLLEQCVRRDLEAKYPNRIGICDEAGKVYRWVELRRVELADLLVLLAEAGFSVVPPKKSSILDWEYDALILR